MFTLKSGEAEDEPILSIDFFRWGGKQPPTRMSRNMKEERIASPKWENLCNPKKHGYLTSSDDFPFQNLLF